MIVISLILLLVFCGCSEIFNKGVDVTSINQANGADANQGIAIQSEIFDNGVDVASVNQGNDAGVNQGIATQDEDFSVNRRVEPLSIKVDNNFNLKNEIISHISISETKNSVNNRLYSEHKVSDIPQFYALDNLLIDGYRLYHVNITEGSFLYRFVPIEEFYDENVVSTGLNNILIPVKRWEWFDEKSTSKLMEREAEQGWGYLNEDGMIYSQNNNEITAPIGNTIFRVQVPDKLNNYDFLHDIAQQVIKSAEIVDVKHELDVLRRSEN